MKIAILGSTQYVKKMSDYALKLNRRGHAAVLPVLDNHPLGMNEIDIMKENLELIKWCDEAHFIWDQRSIGAYGDFCMCFALGKKVKLVYMESKLISNFMRQYEKECKK